MALNAGCEAGAVARQIGRLFEAGTAAGLTDAQLLERFVSGRDGGASFAALLERHGPMVLGVCRDLLRDPHAAEDAFQATFLVLVRKAGSVRVDDSLGRWLYGVATRVARHARGETQRRREREGGLEADPPNDRGGEGDAAERQEARAALHEELGRLSESHRAAVVLCHLQGLTHDEAARRLRLPVGTVRSRLARARDRLRERLARRGVSLAVIVPGSWPGFGELPGALHARALGAAGKVAAGRLAAAGVVPAAVAGLTEGVLSTMWLTKLKIIGMTTAATLALSAGGAATLIRGQDDVAPAVAPARPAAPAQSASPAAPAAAAASDDVLPPPQPAAAPAAPTAPRGRRGPDVEADEAPRARSARRTRPAPAAAPAPTLTPAAEAPAAPADDDLPPPPSVVRRRPTSVPVPSQAAAEDALPPVEPRPASADPFAVARSADLAPAGANGTSAYELGVRLEQVRSKLKRTEALRDARVISTEEYDMARQDVALVEAQIRALHEDLGDEVERLKIAVKKAEAALSGAAPRKDAAAAKLARLQRLRTESRAGVAVEEIAEAEGELQERQADMIGRQLDLEESQLRLKQAERRLMALDRLAGLIDRAEPAGEEPARRVSVPSRR